MARCGWANALLTATAVSGFALSPACHQQRRTAAPATVVLESLVCKESNEELIHDIEVMEDEAKHRLHNLVEQMDELQAFQTTNTSTSSSTSSAQQLQKEHHATTEQAAATNTETRTDPIEKTVQQVHLSASAVAPGKAKEEEGEDNQQRQHQEERRSKQVTRTTTQPPEQQQQQQSRKELVIVRSRPLDLLGDTSWKIVFDIGREQGTWMPAQWGKSGSHLRVEIHCTFSSSTAVANTKDPFFSHSTEPVRCIQIEEAFVWPTTVGVGRRPLKIDPQAGRYQVCPGVGPAGTDLLRLMIPIPVDLKKDDITLNAGPVYGTTGYFGHPDEGRQQIINTVQQEYDHCLAECAKLQRELLATDNFVAWCRARHAVWTAERALDRAVDRMTMAGHHYPDHAHMRTDPSGRVGLAKEGGLCVSVHTGVAMEYHILGRMEVGKR
jgi:hypothetical protein